MTTNDVPPETPYGLSKREAEKQLKAIAENSSLEIVIVRPPLVYGPHARGNIEALLGIISKNIPLPFARVNNLRSMIFVENLADALITCAIHEKAAGKTFFISDDQDLSTADLIRYFAKGMGKSPKLFPFPVSLLKFSARCLGKEKMAEKMLGSLQVNIDPIKKALNWFPPFSPREGLLKTAEAFTTV